MGDCGATFSSILQMYECSTLFLVEQMEDWITKLPALLVSQAQFILLQISVPKEIKLLEVLKIFFFCVYGQYLQNKVYKVAAQVVNTDERQNSMYSE